LVLVGAAPGAEAATFRVDSIKDKVDVALDGQCEAANGRCSLRAAIQESRSGFFPGLDVIKLRAETYKLKDVESSVVDTPDLDVQEQVTIAGRGMGRTTIRQTVAGAGVFELHLAAGVTTMRRLTVRGGRAEGGAGISSLQALVLDQVKVTDNEGRSDFSTRGGGLATAAALTVVNSKVMGNRIHTTGAGASALGGGIAHEAADSGDTIEIRRSVISGNRATVGGAATNAGAGGIRTTGPAVIQQSTIQGNESEGAGGGIVHTGSAAGSQLLTVSRSTISGNEARSGGGIVAFEPVAIENSTVSGNTVTGPFANGGGIYRGGGTTIGLDHATVADNRAPPGSVGGLLSDPSSGTITIGASIVANPGLDCGGAGTITSLGYNVGAGTDCPLSAIGDLDGAHPRLGALDRNGGPTRTHKLRAGSDARNAVTSGCPPPVIDQRGIDRPQGSACDAGSYEKD
jgi:hypothetical protein